MQMSLMSRKSRKSAIKDEKPLMQELMSTPLIFILFWYPGPEHHSQHFEKGWRSDSCFLLMGLHTCQEQSRSIGQCSSPFWLALLEVPQKHLKSSMHGALVGSMATLMRDKLLYHLCRVLLQI
jgi:hypothetical protein